MRSSVLSLLLAGAPSRPPSPTPRLRHLAERDRLWQRRHHDGRAAGLDVRRDVLVLRSRASTRTPTATLSGKSCSRWPRRTWSPCGSTSYFTYAKLAGTKLLFKPPTDYWLEHKDKALTCTSSCRSTRRRRRRRSHLRWRSTIRATSSLSRWRRTTPSFLPAPPIAPSTCVAPRRSTQPSKRRRQP